MTHRTSVFALFFVIVLYAMAVGQQRPNIVFVITDDQGYGDLACHGNPIIRTPHIDRLAAESTCLTDYHVAPTCSPTRAALLTGHWTNRTGVWHTVNGRSMLRADEVTLGQLFQVAGYATGMFGKWHLGDNFPYRAEDRGFAEVYRHGGGGVGQTPDVWDNAYFDGAYFHNGEIAAADGFCTDVFFAQSHQFIRRCVAEERPFLAYIATNAPHGPLHAPQPYLDMYVDQNPRIASFYGMITNIDDNVGKTRELLRELGVERNTIFIFTTDNGTASGQQVFNAGMRGKKGSEYEGGHRVPFFVYWPARGIEQRRIVTTLTHAVDIVPTLLDMAEIQPADAISFDGRSLRPLLEGRQAEPWPARFLVTDSQRVRDPIKWRKSAVMQETWRLINGQELYDIRQDPGQRHDVADQHPQRVAAMRDFYESWWAELEPTFAQTTEIYLGHPDQGRAVTLTGHDWIQQANPPWSQAHVRNGHGVLNGTDVDRHTDEQSRKHDGHWAVRVIEAGTYQIALRRWPVETAHPITAGLPAAADVPGASRAIRARPGVALPITQATLRIDGKDLESRPVKDGDQEVSFRVELAAGSHQLSPYFQIGDSQLGAFYAAVTKAN